LLINLYPYLPKPILATRGVGFLGLGYRLAQKNPGLPLAVMMLQFYKVDMNLDKVVTGTGRLFAVWNGTVICTVMEGKLLLHTRVSESMERNTLHFAVGLEANDHL